MTPYCSRVSSTLASRITTCELGLARSLERSETWMSLKVSSQCFPVSRVESLSHAEELLPAAAGIAPARAKTASRAIEAIDLRISVLSLLLRPAISDDTTRLAYHPRQVHRAAASALPRRGQTRQYGAGCLCCHCRRIGTAAQPPRYRRKNPEHGDERRISIAGQKMAQGKSLRGFQARPCLSASLGTHAQRRRQQPVLDPDAQLQPAVLQRRLCADSRTRQRGTEPDAGFPDRVRTLGRGPE